MKKIIILLSFILILSSCSDSTNTQSYDLTRCLEVPSDLVNWIQEWLTIDWWGTFTNVQAVKSNDYDNVYFISWYINWAWIEKDKYIAMFASNSLELWGWLIGSVNSFAKEFSVYLDFKEVNQFDDWGKESEYCVKNKK